MSTAPLERPFTVSLSPEARRCAAPIPVIQLFIRGAKALAKRLTTEGSSIDRVVEFAPKVCAFTASVRIHAHTREVLLVDIRPRAASHAALTAPPQARRG